MNIDRGTIHKHIVTISIVIFLLLFGFINMLKPDFIYNKDNTLRSFGIGYIKKTVIPIWLFAIILAILSYFVILYYVHYPILMNS